MVERVAAGVLRERPGHGVLVAVGRASVLVLVAEHELDLYAVGAVRVFERVQEPGGLAGPDLGEREAHVAALAGPERARAVPRQAPHLRVLERERLHRLLLHGRAVPHRAVSLENSTRLGRLHGRPEPVQRPAVPDAASPVVRKRGVVPVRMGGDALLVRGRDQYRVGRAGDHLRDADAPAAVDPQADLTLVVGVARLARDARRPPEHDPVWHLFPPDLRVYGARIMQAARGRCQSPCYHVRATATSRFSGARRPLDLQIQAKNVRLSDGAREYILKKHRRLERHLKGLSEARAGADRDLRPARRTNG